MTTKLSVARSSQWVKSGRAAVPFVTTTGREALILGAYRPSSATAGVLPGVTRSTVTAASQLPGGGLTPGTTYENLNIQFVMTPPTGTAVIRFRNCLFQGTAAAPSSALGVVKLFNANHCPVEFYDCSFSAQTPSPWWNGLHGHTFKAYRCDIYGVCDAVSVFNTADPTGPLNVTVEQCYMHDFLWYPYPQFPGTSNPDGSHDDGFQLQGGSGFVFRGNYINGFNDPDYVNTYYGTLHANAVGLIKPDVGVITGVVIEQNWFYGGAAGLNITHDAPARYLTNIGSIKQNRFGRDQRRGDTWAIVRTSDITYDAGTGSPGTQNVYDDNNAVVTPRNA